MAWVEKFSKSTTLLKDLVEALTTANRDPDTGEPIPEMNWSLIYPREETTPSRMERGTFVFTPDDAFKVYTPPADKLPKNVDDLVISVNGKVAPSELAVTGVKLTDDGSHRIYQVAESMRPWILGAPVNIYVNNVKQTTKGTSINETATADTANQVFTLAFRPVRATTLQCIRDGLLVTATSQVVGETPAHKTPANPNYQDYVLANTNVESIEVFKNGTRMNEGYAFVGATGTLRFAVPNAETDVILVNYVYRVFSVDEVGGKVTFTKPQTDSILTFTYDYGSYDLDMTSGTVTFYNELKPTDVVAADFSYVGRTYSLNTDASGHVTSVEFVYPLNHNDQVTAEYEYEVPAQTRTLEEQLNDPNLERIILKTTTTPRTNLNPDPNDPDSLVESLTAYLEVRRPLMLRNPNTGNPEWYEPDLDPFVNDDETMTHYQDGTIRLAGWRAIPCGPNHHFIEMRIIDKLNEETCEPAVDAKVSAWAKLNWYKDWETIPLDQLYPDGKGVTAASSNGMTGYKVASENVDNFFDGLIMRPITTALVKDPVAGDHIPVKFWMNCDNNRIALVVQGDPVCDFKQYLIAFAYVGQLDSFEGSHDVAGNFAITTGSSTPPNAYTVNVMPGKVKVKTYQIPTDHVPHYNHTNDVKSALPSGAQSIRQSSETVVDFEFFFVAEDDMGRSEVSDVQSVSYQKQYKIYYQLYESYVWRSYTVDFTNSPTSIQFTVDVPERASQIRVYRREKGTKNAQLATIVPLSKMTPDGNGGYIFSVDPFSGFESDEVMSSSPLRDEDFTIRRDPKGNITGYTFPQQNGQYTGTGVLDVNMLRTKSGMAWQRHAVAVVTTDRTMPKDQNGYSLSQWTKKFHLSPIYVVHGAEGVRGYLGDVLNVDGRLLYHLDDLIVDRGTPNEKVYKFFKLSAPFSVFESVSDGNFGIAILKETKQTTQEGAE